MTVQDLMLLEEITLSKISKALDKHLGVYKSEEEVEEIIDKELEANNNFINIIGISKFKLSLTELVELTELEEEEVECLEDLRLSYLKDSYIKTLAISIRDSHKLKSLIQRNHRLDVLRRKLEKIYDNKYGKSVNPKGHKKLIIKTALLSLVNNYNLI